MLVLIGYKELNWFKNKLLQIKVQIGRIFHNINAIFFEPTEAELLPLQAVLAWTDL